MVLVTPDTPHTPPSTETGGRPRIVTVAFSAWVSGAVLVVLLGLLSVTFPADTLRSQLMDTGGTPDAVDSVVSLLRAVGVVEIVVGLGIGFLAGPACRGGDARFRRAGSTLSVIFALMLIGALTVGLVVVPVLAMVSAILFVVAPVLAYRPSASTWFRA